MNRAVFLAEGFVINYKESAHAQLPSDQKDTHQLDQKKNGPDKVLLLVALPRCSFFIIFPGGGGGGGREYGCSFFLFFFFKIRVGIFDGVVWERELGIQRGMRRACWI